MDINDAELEMIGYTKDEIVGKKTWADLILPEQRTEFEGHWRDIIAEGQVQSFNYMLVHKDGHQIDVLLNASARFDKEGHLINTRGSVLNITERKRLERELLNIVERERQRIGQELHDSIGQQLTGIAFMLEVLGEKLAGQSSTEEEVLYAEKINRRVNQAVELARNLAKGLHPIDLERKGLAFALQELTDNTKQIFNVSCTFKCDKAVSISHLSVAINLYRIAQEAITNAVKHGKARNIRIEITSQNDSLILTVENDGIDFPEGETHTEGMGLKIMRYRAELMNSSIDIRRGCNEGTIITCVLPN